MNAKKIILFCLLLFCVQLFAQNTTTLTFTGKDRNNTYVQLDRVSVTNHSKRWQEMLFYPDTTLTLGTTGIVDYTGNNTFRLFQNTPNPFDGTTKFSLQLNNNENVVLEIFDVTGKLVANYCGSLTSGTHLFQATLSSPQTYLLNARIEDGMTHIKMINTGIGNTNTIKYMGLYGDVQEFETKEFYSLSNLPFDSGDMMEYFGYATINDIECESQHKMLSQLSGSQYFTLLFDAEVVLPPTITIDSIRDVSVSSASIYSHVVNNNDDTIIELGVCWCTDGLPVYSDWHQAINEVVNPFSNIINSLDSGTTYYVRAYAINSVGIGYSTVQSFTTLNLPDVVTLFIDNLFGNTTADLTGVISCQVVSENGSSVVERGVVWDTIPIVGCSGNVIVSGSGIGNYVTTMNDLTPHTTYYVRSFATNDIGTRCGNELSFTTPDMPVVINLSVDSVTAHSAVATYQVVSCEGSPTVNGICISTHPDASLSDATLLVGNGIGTFQMLIDSLTPYTTYYVRAYATNTVGTSYSEEVTFSTEADVPLVQTIGVPEISNVFAIATGNVISDNGSPIVTRGICWSTTNQPTISDSVASNDGTLGQFSLPINNLDPGQNYFIRAFATNDIGTGYGDVVTFRTLNTENINGFDVSWNDSVTPDQQEVIRQILNNMVIVAGGNATIGSTQQENESPVHTAKINTFGIGKYEVTQKEWSQIVNIPEVSSQWSNTYGLGDTFPAYNFSYDQFQLFISRLCELTSLSFRMPTESEWEYAARGGIHANNYQYSGSDIVENVAWYTNNANSSSHAVGGKDANSLGIYDMSGNVWEWCSDWYGMYSPGTYSNPTGSSNGTARVMRGGCWYFNEDYCRVSARYSSSPSNTFITYGGRLAIDVLPRVSTSPIIDINTTSANWGGTVSDGIAAEVVERGLCWGTNANVSIFNDTIKLGSGTGSFDYAKIGLAANTTYFVRAYAINQFGIGYGDVQAFTTPADNTQEYINGITVNWGNGVTANQQEVIRQILNKMIAVEGGSCSMSNDFHAVINPFFIGKFEITQKEWMALMGATPTSSGSQWTTNLGFGNNFPAYYVSYEDVLSFLQILNAYTGIVFRLPTEAEWEYAARGGRQTSNNLYAGSNAIGTVAWYSNNSSAHEVGLLQNNEIGTFDMSGNVAEWCSDYYGTLNPGIYNNPAGPASGTTRVVRGGGYNSLSSSCTVFARDSAVPDTRSATIGFRLAISADSHGCFNQPTLIDVDGNAYHTVQIGSQCWMKENLRTTKFSNEIGIPVGTDTSSSIAYRYNPNHNQTAINTYGYLYNWPAIMNNMEESDTFPSRVQGICPTGWHVPSEAEWILLHYYVTSRDEYHCGGSNAFIAKSLASNMGWSTSDVICSIGNDPYTNNATGFNALPAGYIDESSIDFERGAYFWSCSGKNTEKGISHFLKTDNQSMNSRESNKRNALSLRCVLDNPMDSISPSITTTQATDISAFTATSGGFITGNGDVMMILRGVCWSTSPNPTILDEYTTDGCVSGEFVSDLENLLANTTYYVRAYVICNASMFYASQISFTTNNHCGNTSDREGRSYNTVAIGHQCWMNSNLRTTRYQDNTSLVYGENNSYGAYYYYGGNSSNSTYGLLYNHSAVMRNDQGICPIGWHIPSATEWNQLISYLKTQNRYLCSTDTNTIAKSLASTNGWDVYAEPCTVGNNPNSNNSTSFNAYPLGGASYRNTIMQSSGQGRFSEFWSSSGYQFYLFAYYDSGVRSLEADGASFLPVRCVKD
ncbi:MAG: SUMF1/EgtB/PvdO family nonheme iron enzyme [Bacteroidales bacterium]|nr:SUMF1/EgtB/PvdO family nonheme iron enzyme [Bacteroidales bacterium]